MTHEEILSAMYEELSEFQTDPRLSLSEQSAGETTIEAVGLSSLEMLQLILNLEDRLSVPLTLADFPKLSTLAQIAEHISGLKEKGLKNTR